MFVHHVPRSSGRRGGGVGVLTNNSIKMTSCLQPVNVAQSFESMEIIITIVSVCPHQNRTKLNTSTFDKVRRDEMGC